MNQNELIDNKQLVIGVVTSRFNEEVTQKLREGAFNQLIEKGILESNIIDVSVPGAFEIPLAIQKLLKMKSVNGVIALGAVIRGETTHYDYVCESVERGCSRLQLKYKKPVGFGILTTENEEQAFDRVGGHHGHKGKECADVVIEMIQLLKKLEEKNINNKQT